MEENDTYTKLPTEEKCVHTVWKARLAGYEEALKLFNQIDDEKAPEWNKYLGLIKKFVTDSNATAQEKGLEAALVFVENCGHAGKTASDAMSGIVAKCVAAPKTKTKELALQVILMYVEIEKHEAVQEELLKGMEHKNPKVVSASTAALTTALRQFGNKVIAIKPMVKKIPVLLADRDKAVRDEMKALVAEMHRWIGAAVEPHIASLQPVQQQELRQMFTEGGAQPTRYLRSQQQKVRQAEVDNGDGATEDEDFESASGDVGDCDPYSLLDPVEILSKLPKDFYTKLDSAPKWQDRKEMLDALENLLKNAPKLEPGDYADLVRALKKTISKDKNVMLVAQSGNLLAQVARGLRNKFQPYAVACVSSILEKFKEKKTNVVTAMRDAIDAIYPSTNLEAIMEEVLAAFDNKNPSVKAETALFISRVLCHTQPAAFGKKLLKAYVAGLLKLLESADPTVRDAAAEALGTATKLVGEKNIAPHIGKLDNLKEQKIKEAAEKAVIQVKTLAPKKETKPKVAATGKGDGKPTAGSNQPKPVAKKAPAKKPGSVAGKKPSAVRRQPSPAVEQDLSQEEVEAKAETFVPGDVMSGLADGDWKTRLSSAQSFLAIVRGLSPDEASAQLLFKIINRGLGLRDTNVQVLKARLEVTKYIAENFTISTTAVDAVLQDIVSKLGEASCTNLCADCLTSLAIACGLEHVANEALSFAMDSQKNPKVHAELFNWLANAVREFGFSLNLRSLVPHLKKALSATNPNVRTSAVNLIGVLSMYVGPSIINHFDTEKAATKQLISLEVDKYANSEPPTPTRLVGSVSKSASRSSIAEATEEDMPEEKAAPAEDAKPRIDLAPLITDALIAEINDKNWKIRNEGLEKLKALISSAPIKPTLGELPPVLTARILDSNSKLAQTALQICETIATHMGPKCKAHSRTFFPAFFQAFGDNKAYIRAAAVSCVETWCEVGGPSAPFEGEMVAEALNQGSPVTRQTALTWLAKSVGQIPPKTIPREELIACLPILYSCLEDRSAEVRKAASDCVLPFMLHIGYDPMFKQLDKLKPGSKQVVQAALDKARPNLPVQPLPSKAKKDDGKAVKTAGALKKDAEKKGTAPGKGKAVRPATAVVSSKKKDDEDISPLLPNNNSKNQRIIDDQKLKVLKWNFVTPREEFFELLKEQMTSAGLNKQLVANMFHSDFRYHLKAIESLSEDLHENGSALIANLDLVLKWLTLRFYDTNPSVILKGLEYLSTVFNYLMDSDYTMPEYEANCFIPYLIIKVGDPKDAVRNGVKALFKQICVVYSVTKLFGYLMEGLKSKNARQRAECLECIGVLIETYGWTVLGTSAGGGPAGASSLRELARHIGDRDNGVRSAALNCVASAYFLQGERVYKMIGQISDKDLSLLEERIKRAGKSRSAEVRRSMVVPLSASGRALQQNVEEEAPRRVISVDAIPGGDYEEEEVEEEEIEPEVVAQPTPEQPRPKVVQGPFGLDPELIAELDSQAPKLKKLQLPTPDLKFLEEPIAVPNVRSNVPSSHFRPNTVQMQTGPTSMLQPSSGMMSHYQHQQQQSSHMTQVDDTALVETINAIASPDVNTCIRALSLMSGALVSGRGAALAPLEDSLVCCITRQLSRARTQHAQQQHTHTHTHYKYLASTLTAFYETAGCGSRVSEAAIGQLLSELLRILGSERNLGNVGGGERLVRILNNVCVRLLENSANSPLLCAIITLLHDSIGNVDPDYPRYQELLLKCFWKTLKMMSSWESVDYEAVLYKIHLFYKHYPNAYWKKSPDMSDTPYRTVKTLVHTLVKMRGTGITHHLSKIPDINESELYPYVLKVFKQLKLDDKKENTADTLNGSSYPIPANNSALSANRLPRDVHEQLAGILQNLSNRQHNKDALTQLYELRERHPEVDIWTHMQGSSFYFRNFVERGLKDVAEQRRHNHPYFTHEHTRTIHSDLNNENDEKSHIVFLERLRALQAKAGLKSETISSAQPRTPISDNRMACDTINENVPKTNTIDPQFELNTTHASSHRNEKDVDALRLKLQQIKSSAKR